MYVEALVAGMISGLIGWLIGFREGQARVARKLGPVMEVVADGLSSMPEDLRKSYFHKRLTPPKRAPPVIKPVAYREPPQAPPDPPPPPCTCRCARHPNK